MAKPPLTSMRLVRDTTWLWGAELPLPRDVAHIDIAADPCPADSLGPHLADLVAAAAHAGVEPLCRVHGDFTRKGLIELATLVFDYALEHGLCCAALSEPAFCTSETSVGYVEADITFHLEPQLALAVQELQVNQRPTWHSFEVVYMPLASFDQWYKTTKGTPELMELAGRYGSWSICKDWDFADAFGPAEWIREFRERLECDVIDDECPVPDP